MKNPSYYLCRQFQNKDMKKIAIITILFLTSLSYPIGAYCCNACPVKPHRRAGVLSLSDTHGSAYLPGNAPDTIRTLEAVTVTASRIESTAQESGRSVTVLQAKEIEALPVESVDELLRLVAGVNINSRNAFGVQSDIGMRGSTFSQVVIMLDNMRINNPLTAHYNCNIPVALHEIAQIEVIRGAAGTSFGPDAVGGIIHIKTKTYLDKNSQGLSSSGSLGAGQYGLRTADAGVAFSNDHITVSLSAKASIADGPEYDNPNALIVEGADSAYNNFFNLQNYTAALSWNINKQWRLFLRGGNDTRNYAAKYYYTTSAYDESVEDMYSYWSQFSLFHQQGNKKTEINGSWTQGGDTFLFNPLFGANVHNTNVGSVSANHTIAFDGGLQIAFGAQGGIRSIESTDRGDHTNHSAGLYGILSKSFHNNLRATFSSRLDYDDNFGVEYLPHLSLAWNPGNFTVRGSAGKAVRGGDFTERYVSYAIPQLSPGRNLGNPNLEAEKAWSFEVGTDYNTDKGIAGVTLFHRASTDLIDYTYTLSDNITTATNLIAGEYNYYARNVASATTSGVEVQTSQQVISHENHALKVNLSYTLMHTTTGDDEPSKYIANHPKHIINAGVAGHIGIIKANITGTFINRDKEAAEAVNGEIKASYFVLNAQLEVTPIKDKVGFYIQAYNISNTEYQEVLGARMPGRWISGGVKWRL